MTALWHSSEAFFQMKLTDDLFQRKKLSNIHMKRWCELYSLTAMRLDKGPSSRPWINTNN